MTIVEILALVLLFLGAIFFALALSPRARAGYEGWVPAGLLAWIVSVILDRIG